jgi:hypothetical protein
VENDGMIDEPKKRSWARFWTARIGWTVLALLLLYPASFPPVIGWALRCNQGDAAVSFYRPLLWVMRRSPTFHDAIDWYSLNCWNMTFDIYDDPVEFNVEFPGADL